MRSADADGTTGAGVRPLGALANHDEVDVRVAGQRAVDAGEQPRRPQVHVVIQGEPHGQQQATLEHAAGHRWIADGAQQDCVVRLELVDHALGQGLPGLVVALGTHVVLGALDTRPHDIEDLQCLADDLGADAVTGDDGELHDRSTSSSVVAPTASPIALSTSAGTSRSSRSMTVAPEPSESCDI